MRFISKMLRLSRILHLRRIALVGLSLLVTACGRPSVEPLDLSPGVDQFIPADIDRSEVNRGPDGCYFYTYASSLFQVLDGNGDPVCQP